MARLLVKQGINQGMEWDLGPEVCVVGRDLRNAVCLTDLRVSRRHFQIEKRGARFHAVNLSQTNGTFVGGEMVSDHVLRDGDEILIGDTVLEFRQEEPATAGGGIDLAGDATIVWMPAEDDRLAEQNINYTINMRESSITRLGLGENDLRKLKVVTERLAMLQELSNALVQEFDEKRLMNLLMDQIFSVLPADTGHIFVMDPARLQKLVPVVARERGRDDAPPATQISRSLALRAIGERLGILSQDTLSDERFKDQGSIILSGIRSALCVPMVVGDDVLGLVHLATKSVAREFAQDDLELLTMMANQAAISLRNARLREHIVAEQAQRQMLSRYVSPQLIEQLAREGFSTDGGSGRANRVYVTVLYCDIRGFTTLSETMEPEDVLELLNVFCEKMAELVFSHNGSVDKYIGDCVMAVFGSPAPEPLHALRAIECGVAMRSAAESLRVGDKRVRVGVGIHTGECVQGNIGPDNMMQFTAIGDTVNTASRLCGIAGPEKVVISEATAREAKAHSLFALEPMGEVELKGKSEKLKVMNVVGALGAAAEG